MKSEARRLSLRALLHFLWNEAGLTKWTSAWADKRHWWNIRWHLIEAARTMIVKGGPLSDMLLVPEPFRAANKEAIEPAARREAEQSSSRRRVRASLCWLSARSKSSAGTRRPPARRRAHAGIPVPPR